MIGVHGKNWCMSRRGKYSHSMWRVLVTPDTTTNNLWRRTLDELPHAKVWQVLSVESTCHTKQNNQPAATVAHARRVAGCQSVASTLNGEYSPNKTR